MGDSRWVDCPVVIPYMGGKFELSRKLIPMLAPHVRYIEMFAGGLSMYFRKNKVKWNVVNDYDSDIANLYESIRTNLKEFQNHAYWMVKSREIFIEFRRQVHENKKIDIPEPERAAKYYYVIKNAFNKNVNATISKDSKSWKSTMLEDLKYSRQLLDNIMIENLDFRKLVEKYPPREGDMWYMDPPYIVAGERKDYYFFDFNMDDHKALADMCDIIHESGGKFMVSYDDRDEVKELYKDYNINVLKIIYSGQQHHRIEKNELVITNYEPPSQQKSLF